MAKSASIARHSLLIAAACVSCQPSDPSVGAGVDDPGSTDTTGDGVEEDGSSSSTETGDSPPADDTAGNEDAGEDAPPVARDDGPYTAPSGRALEVDAEQGVLSNDEDPDGGDLVVVSFDAVAEMGGEVLVSPDGSFSYQPPKGLPFGTDRFEYVVEDEAGHVATAQVRVVVLAADGAVGLGELGRKGVRFLGVGPDQRCCTVVSGAGDVDADGYADVVLGAGGADPDGAIDAGEVYTMFGGADLPSEVLLSSADVVFQGVGSHDYAGIAAGIGDVDDDGFGDLLVGANRADPGGLLDAGELYLHFGREGLAGPTSLSGADVRLAGADSGDWTGTSIDGAGDVDGDGYSDFLVGANNALGSAGRSYLVFGGEHLEMSPAVALEEVEGAWFDGVGAGDWSGRFVRGVGDVDGDGYDDIMIGAPWADPNGVEEAGESYLVFGGPRLRSASNVGLGSADVRFEGMRAHGLSGLSIGAGDVNGDGYSDVLIGVPNNPAFDDIVANAGAVHIFFGRSRGSFLPVMSLVGADVRIDGSADDDHFGLGVGHAGDINGDGYDDLFVGAYSADPDGVVGAGEAYVMLGRPNLPKLMGAHDAELRFSGAGAGEAAGVAVAFVDDVDGDGFGDILVGAPSGNDGAGEAYLIYGDDIAGTTTVLGTAGDDETFAVLGPAEGDVVIGGRGDDVLRSDGGPDVLKGGQGDDTIVIVDDEALRVDGGLGQDTLELEAGVVLSEAVLSRSRVTGIEGIRLGEKGSSSVSLSELTVLGLSDTSNTLTIDGDEDDEVVLATGTWGRPRTDGRFEVYMSLTTAAVLRVDSAVQVTSVP